MSWYRALGKGPAGVTRQELHTFKCTYSDGPSYELDVQDGVFHNARPVGERSETWLWGERGTPGGSLRGLGAAEVPHGGANSPGGRLVATLTGLAVARQHQHQGLGTIGLAAILADIGAEAIFREVSLIVITKVHEENARSQRLCLRMGFEPDLEASEQGYRWWNILYHEHR